MATAPDVIRRGLVRITGRAQAEVRAVTAAAAQNPRAWRAAMFEAAPLIVAEYAPGSATLGLDWFEERRDDAAPAHAFTPTPRLNVTDDDVTAMIAALTKDIEAQIDADAERILAEITAEIEAAVQKEVAAGFWDTVTENTAEDPDAVGWQRYTRPDGCKFCRMLADRGAVYTEATVRFAAHTTCHCVVGPSYDPDAPTAGVMQYLASQRQRSPEDKARLRAYLNKNFPDAPG